jgi:NTE family protein
MNRCLAFVLGGGGARGAMQVGALRALIEAGFKPDLLVGTSIGAINAAGLALRGVDLDGIGALERAYREMAVSNLMDPRLARLTLRALSGRPNHHATRRVAEFLIAEGITPDLHFDQIANVRLALIGADLASGQPVIYGQDPGQAILEGLLASIALPPWFAPAEKDDQYIVDGGVLSNLPIEPALTMGATEIIALDLGDPASAPGNEHALDQYLGKLVFAIVCRQVCLETALAEAQGVPVHRIELRSSPPIPIWDFSNYRELIQIGYEIASHEVPGQVETSQPELDLPSLITENQPCWEFA